MKKLNGSQESYQEFNLSEEEKLITESIESLPLGDFDKADLILILQGLKEATDFRIPSEKYQTFCETLKKLNLEIAIDESQDEGDEIVGVYVAKTKETAEKCRAAWSNFDDNELGRLSGYPKSAIEAYAQIKKLTGSSGVVINMLDKLFINISELPETLKQEDFLAFVHFRLSRAHFSEELETVKHWAEIIQKQDPALYKRVVAWYRRGK
jgi:hypothetical protein